MRVVLAAVGVCLCLATPAGAVSARSWSASTPEELAVGTLEGTMLDDRGRLRLARETETLWGPEDGIVWGVAALPGRAALVALSGPGRLLRVDATAEPEVWFLAAEESLVTSLVVDDDGAAVFGLSPEGRVLRAAGPREVEVLAETGAKFVWSLARGAEGALWIGTGIPGRVLRRTDDGRLETVLETDDDPVRCIAPLPGGGVVIGTGGRGRVIRIDTDDRAFVLWDAGEPEIASVAVTADGTIFALGARGAKQVSKSKDQASAPPPEAGATVQVYATPPPDAGGQAAAQAKPTKTADKAQQSFTSPAGGALYRIDPDGSATTIWETMMGIPFVVLLDDAGGVIVSTGDSGRLFTIDAQGRSAKLLRVASTQASALARGGDGSILVGGTTDARVERIGPALRESGTYLAPVIDAGGLADWGRVHWDVELPRGTNIGIEVRVGNSADPDETWTEWRKIGNGAGDVPVAAPPTRYLQARFELTSRRDASPELRRLQVYYTPRNRPPHVVRLDVEPHGMVWIHGPTQASNRLGPFVADDPVSRASRDKLKRTVRKIAPIRKAYEAGARTFTWQVDDPDGDKLEFRLEIRRDDSDEWFPIATGVEDDFLSWDSRAMPDARYRVRLTAVDRPGNPDGKERSAQRVSESFVLDNRRPGLEGPEVRSLDRGLSVSFVARDPGGIVAAVEVGIDGAEWRPLDPVDGVADSEEERYELVVEPLDDRPRSLMVRVTDSAGNLGGDMWVVDAP